MLHSIHPLRCPWLANVSVIDSTKINELFLKSLPHPHNFTPLASRHKLWHGLGLSKERREEKVKITNHCKPNSERISPTPSAQSLIPKKHSESLVTFTPALALQVLQGRDVVMPWRLPIIPVWQHRSLIQQLLYLVKKHKGSETDRSINRDEMKKKKKERFLNT